MRVGIFGGSFDPPHVGHLLVAQDAHEALRLDHLLIIPTGTQPLKGAQTAAQHRLAMTQRCFGSLPYAAVDPIEVDRGGVSYTVETVEALRARWPGAELLLLVGQDVADTLPRWREPERLLSMVRLVVVVRTSLVEDPAPARPAWAPATWMQLATRRVDVSSTEIRERVRDGRSLAGFVPDAVASYIASEALYVQG